MAKSKSVSARSLPTNFISPVSWRENHEIDKKLAIPFVQACVDGVDELSVLTSLLGYSKAYHLAMCLLKADNKFAEDVGSTVHGMLSASLERKSTEAKTKRRTRWLENLTKALEGEFEWDRKDPRKATKAEKSAVKRWVRNSKKSEKPNKPKTTKTSKPAPSVEEQVAANAAAIAEILAILRKDA